MSPARRGLSTVFLVFLILSGLVARATAADGSWEERTRSGEWAFARGDFETAEVEFQAALDLAAKFGPDDPRLEESLRNLARVCEFQSKLDRAEPLYQLLLAAEEHRLGKDSPQLLSTLAAIARTAIPSGDHPTAMESLHRYVEIAGSLEEVPNPDQYRAMLSTMARMEMINDNGPEGLRYQRKATGLAMEDSWLELEDKIAALENLVRMEFQFGDAGAGRDAVRRKAALLRQADREAAAAAAVLGGARMALDAGAFDMAVELVSDLKREDLDEQQLLSAAEIKAGALYSGLRISAADLGALYAGAREGPQYREVAAAYEELFELQERQFPSDDPRIRVTLTRIVKISLLRGRLGEAIDADQKVIEMLRRTTDRRALAEALEEHLEILRLDPSQKDAALRCSAELIAVSEELWGSESRSLVPLLKTRYNLLIEAHRKKEARKLKKRIRALER